MDVNKNCMWTNHTQGSSDEKVIHNAAWNWIEFVLLVLFSVLGIAGNSIVISVYKPRWLQSSTVFYIFILAILDLVTSLICIPSSIVKSYYAYILDQHEVMGRRDEDGMKGMCFLEFYWYMLIIEIFLNFWILSTCMVLIGIAWDRFKAVSDPYRRRDSFHRSRMWVCISLGAMFIFAIIFRLDEHFEWPPKFKSGTKYDQKDYNSTKVVFDVIVWGTLLILIVLYILVFRHVRIFARDREKRYMRKTSVGRPEANVSWSQCDGRVTIGNTMDAGMTTDNTKVKLTDKNENNHASSSTPKSKPVAISLQTYTTPPVLNETSQTPPRNPDIVLSPIPLLQSNTKTSNENGVNSSQNENILFNPSPILKKEPGSPTGQSLTWDTLEDHHSLETNVRERSASTFSLKNMALQTRTARVAVFITLTFAISFFPVIAMQHWSSFFVYPVVRKFMYLNAIANPIIYSFCNANFQQDVKMLFSGRRRRRASTVSGIL